MAKKVGGYMDSDEYNNIYGDLLHPKNRKELNNVIIKMHKDQGENLDLTSIDVSSVKDNLDDLFSNNSFAPIVTLNISGWKLRNASSIRRLFGGIKTLKSINVTDVEFNHTDLSKLFIWNNNLEEIIGLETWDVSDVKDFNSMFVGCEKLESINISSWNAKPTSIHNMFNACQSLTEINLENMTLSNVDKAYYFAYDCPELRIVRFPQDRAKMFSHLTDIENMFGECVKLQIIEGIEDCDMQYLNSAEQAFLNCKRLRLDISNWQLNDDCNKTSMLKGARNIMCDWEDAEVLMENRKRSFRYKKITESVNSEVISTLDDYVVLLMMMLKGNVKKTPFNADVRGLQKDLVDSMGIKNTVHSNVLDMDIVYDAYFENGNVIIEFNYDRAEYQFVLDGKMVVCTEIF